MQHDILNDLLMGHTHFCYFISKILPKGSQIPQFCIFGMHVKILLFVQFEWFFSPEMVIYKVLKMVCEHLCLFVCLMMFNATFNNISVISWRSILLVEETGEPRENHRPVASHWQTLSHNVVHVTQNDIRTHNISGGRQWLHR